MLDSETRRRIDTARDILVGKVPDPKSQVEQITIALVYKFMDDMDRQSIEMGGKPSFFKDEFKKYGWAEVFDPRIGGAEMSNLYGEAITRMSLNPNLPQLFRDIFKNAFLPYRDPETLKLFLKIINEFTYDHSERLGDAFEYLLSVLGSQGEAGQFRTPRHIIDFMVSVVDPKRNETVLDPACGTAGFLISAYKHIAESAEKSGKPLTTQDKQSLYENIVGYDISPDMVRLSLVNLYLHGFVKPQIYEYDTLTSEQRWNEYADVILANPPFMSPKGGIQPHKRFSVQSNRSEVLFVDYIAEHLTPNGRAAIIVPEGIIFQTGIAYKQLRKYLIQNDYLWAVASLPAGVFNPYAGVKTSILFFDKALAKKTDQILFVRIEADGYELGAQRRPNLRNDLPDALSTLHTWHKAVLDGKTSDFYPALASTILVSLSRLGENEDFNLSLDRYRATKSAERSEYPMVAIGEICTFEYGKSLKQENRAEGEFPVYGSNGIVGYHNEYLVEAPFIVIGRKGSAGEVHFSDENGFPIDTTFFVKLGNENRVLLKYLYHVLKGVGLQAVNVQAGVPGLNRNDAHKIKIPLPPLDIQRKVVDDISKYREIIDGALQIIRAWRPNLELELRDSLPLGVKAWEVARVVDVADRVSDNIDPREFSGDVNYVGLENIEPDLGLLVGQINAKYEEIKSAKTRFVTNDILYGKLRPNLNKVWLAHFSGVCSTDFFVIRSREMIRPDFLAHCLRNGNFNTEVLKGLGGAQLPRVNYDYLSQLRISVPPLDIQDEIVTRIQREQAIIQGNRELIGLLEAKVKKAIERIWKP